MKRRQGWLFFIIFLLTLSFYLLINYPLQLGLDLEGGSQLTLQIIKEEGKVTRDELEAVNSVIDKRVNNLGVSESNLQTLGGDQLILELPEGDYTCALDQADVVKEGKDITLLTYSRMRHHCLKAVEELEKKGIDVELIDLISLKPFDMETISKSIRKTNKVIIVEECMKTGGIGAELIALITEECFDDLDARPIRLSSQDIPTPYNGNLENLTIIQPHQIVEKVENLISGSI